MLKPQRKKWLLTQLPDLMKGSLAQTSRACGKKGCHCQTGQKHPIYFFTFQFKGKKQVFSIPIQFLDKVQNLINNWKHHKDLIEELTEINVQLIRKGQFQEENK